MRRNIEGKCSAKKKAKSGRNPENTLGMKKDKNSRGGSVSRSRLNADRNWYQVLWIPKGKSSLMIYETYPELKYKYRNREFW